MLIHTWEETLWPYVSLQIKGGKKEDTDTLSRIPAPLQASLHRDGFSRWCRRMSALPRGQETLQPEFATVVNFQMAVVVE